MNSESNREALQGRTVLVSGATSGIGRAVAHLAASAGMKVCVSGRNVQALDELASELGPAGIAERADLSEPQAAAELVRSISTKWDSLGVVVLSAGIGCRDSVEQATPETVEKLLQTNLLGSIRLVQACLPRLRAQSGGHLIFVSSVTTDLIWPNDALYAATKAGLDRFARGLQRELQGSGINVSIVRAGLVDTPLASGPQAFAKVSPDQVARVVLDLIDRPRPLVYVPGRYRWLILLNRLIPGCVDRYIESHTPRGPGS